MGTRWMRRAGCGFGIRWVHLLLGAMRPSAWCTAEFERGRPITGFAPSSVLRGHTADASVVRARSIWAGDRACSIARMPAPIAPAFSPIRLGSIRRTSVASGLDRR